MKLNYNWIENNILIEIQGTLNLEVLLEANAIIFSNSKFDYMNYQIFDFTKIENTDISLREIRAFALLHKSAVRWNNQVHVAIVIANPQLIKEFEVYIQEMKWTNWKCKLFENISDANFWCLKQTQTKADIQNSKA
ncbi:MAG: hypothetical protein KQH79_07475 [Bacteroidetes bacterium]|nr:hypothetical protein [Bacteroidota bacterium]